MNSWLWFIVDDVVFVAFAVSIVVVGLRQWKKEHPNGCPYWRASKQ